MSENAELLCVKKGTEISLISGGTSPLIFQLGGTRPPVAPAFDALDCVSDSVSIFERFDSSAGQFTPFSPRFFLSSKN